jgi:hypothetical protein
MRMARDISIIIEEETMKQLMILLTALVIFQACKDDPETGFRAGSGQGLEDAGTQSVVLDLGYTVSAETVISLYIGGDASLDGDYTTQSSSSNYNSSSETFSLTVKKGESSATLKFDIIDDTQIEPGKEVIYFQVASIGGGESSLDHSTYTYEILDNDSIPASGMQTDLAWNIGEGISIDRVNFDLYLAHNVVITGNEISQSELVDTIQSVHPEGFENFILSTALPDGEYYLVFRYTTGTSDVELFLTLSQSSSIRPLHGVFSEDYAGKDIYYGPIVKKNSRFNYRAAADESDTPLFSLESARFFTGR